jgi:hypothetical protein
VAAGCAGAAVRAERQIGVLSGVDEGSNRVSLAAFLQALKQLGWIESRNIRIDYRWRSPKTANSQVATRLQGIRIL